MAASIKEITQVTIPQEYELVKGEFIKEADSYALTLRHKLSRARVLVLSNEDENKVFNIGFRTPPKDATGVPHIIEHTVLCGSKNFPAKDPFVELVKGSLNTYLNATTYPDKTMYPVASCNDKDFQNLMHVYLDAVFYPNIYKYEKIFKQEGWHYELESEEGELTYNGVVYNEMKGAFSSEEGVLERFVMNSLFPDNTYGNESGGDPRCIPELTYEEYLDFHRTYYHPSNSYIYLYGNMEIEEKLEFLDKNYLSQYPAITVDSEIPLQKPFEERKDLTKNYAVAQDADCTEKTYYCYAAAMDVTLNQQICRAFELLSYVLVEMPGAPVKQALLDEGLGSDIDVEFCDILRQSYFAITSKNAKAGQRERFYQVIRDTLKKIVAEGIDRKALEAAINGMEFREREADFGSVPKGLLYGIRIFKTWLYDDAKPYEPLRYEQYYAFLREQLGSGYYEHLVECYILDNPHSVLVEMAPEPGLALKQEKETAEKLKAYKDSLSTEELRKLIEETKALKKYQEEPTPKEILEKIPMLKREDIDRKVQPYCNSERRIAGIPALHHDVASNDIAYLRFFFDADELEDYVPQISFLCTLLGYMDTQKRSYGEFDTETNFYTGGIASDFHIYCDNNNPGKYSLKFEVSTKVLRSQMGPALNLLAEMMFETLFEDEKHLREVVAESRSRLKVRLMSSGHQAAAGRAIAYISKSGWLNDAYTGLGYYSYLEKLDEHFEEEKDGLIAGCKALLAKLFRKEALFISVAGREAEVEALEKELPEFLERLEKFQQMNGGGSGSGESAGGQIGKGNASERNAGIGNAGAGNASDSNAGIDNVGVGNASDGNAGIGNVEAGNASDGNAGIGNVEAGNANDGNVRDGNASHGMAGTGIAGMEKYVPEPRKRQEAFSTPAEIQYVAVAGSFSEVPYNFGALRVARHLLNYEYLWNEIRVKGGAYGVSCQFNREKEGYFASYRDPNLSATVGVYDRAADFLENYTADEREITKTIIGTISGMDTPLTPNMKGRRSLLGYFCNISEENLQQERNQVLDCSLEDIRSLAPVLRAVTGDGNLCVIGNEKHIGEEQELFEEIKPLS